jgi:hypothetical protein
MGPDPDHGGDPARRAADQQLHRGPADRERATHALTHPGGGEVVQREHDGELPITHGRDRCLLDHAAELQRMPMATTAMHVAVDVPASAAALASEPP